jgi:hypothetical protein
VFRADSTAIHVPKARTVIDDVEEGFNIRA